jgi:hypothetical protein
MRLKQNILFSLPINARKDESPPVTKDFAREKKRSNIKRGSPMHKIKYVVLDKFAVISFTSPVKHSYIKSMLSDPKNTDIFGMEITSAGFYIEQDGEVITYGQSFSLGGIEPSPKDAGLIKAFLLKSYGVR